MVQLVCILHGGPERILVDGKGKKWHFEDHPYCGPVVVGNNGDPLENQPEESSPFWKAVQLWYDQGKRTKDPKTGETWCIWDLPKMSKMRHIGGNHYVLVMDGGPPIKQPLAHANTAQNALIKIAAKSAPNPSRS